MGTFPNLPLVQPCKSKWLGELGSVCRTEYRCVCLHFLASFSNAHRIVYGFIASAYVNLWLQRINFTLSNMLLDLSGNSWFSALGWPSTNLTQILFFILSQFNYYSTVCGNSDKVISWKKKKMTNKTFFSYPGSQPVLYPLYPAGRGDLKTLVQSSSWHFPRPYCYCLRSDLLGFPRAFIATSCLVSLLPESLCPDTGSLSNLIKSLFS